MSAPKAHREFRFSAALRNDPDFGLPLRRAFLAKQRVGEGPDRGPDFDARKRYAAR